MPIPFLKDHPKPEDDSNIKLSHVMLELADVKPLSYIRQIAEFICVDGDGENGEQECFVFTDGSFILLNTSDNTIEGFDQ